MLINILVDLERECQRIIVLSYQADLKTYVTYSLVKLLCSSG